MNTVTMNELVIQLKASATDYQLSYTPGRILGVRQIGQIATVYFLSPPNTGKETCTVCVRQWQAGRPITDGGFLGFFGALIVTGSCFTGDSIPRL